MQKIRKHLKRADKEIDKWLKEAEEVDLGYFVKGEVLFDLARGTFYTTIEKSAEEIIAIIRYKGINPEECLLFGCQLTKKR